MVFIHMNSALTFGVNHQPGAISNNVQYEKLIISLNVCNFCFKLHVNRCF